MRAPSSFFLVGVRLRVVFIRGYIYICARLTAYRGTQDMHDYELRGRIPFLFLSWGFISLHEEKERVCLWRWGATSRALLSFSQVESV